MMHDSYHSARFPISLFVCLLLRENCSPRGVLLRTQKHRKGQAESCIRLISFCSVKLTVRIITAFAGANTD